VDDGRVVFYRDSILYFLRYLRNAKHDGLVRRLKRCFFVIPAKAGSSLFNPLENIWTAVPGLSLSPQALGGEPAGTSFTGVMTFCEFIKHPCVDVTGKYFLPVADKGTVMPGVATQAMQGAAFLFVWHFSGQ
jgi:hypothetical protein